MLKLKFDFDMMSLRLIINISIVFIGSCVFSQSEQEKAKAIEFNSL